MKKRVFIWGCVIMLLCTTVGCTSSNKSSENNPVVKAIEVKTNSEVKTDSGAKANLEVKVVDTKNGKEIEGARFIITDIDKEFILTKDNNKIGLPYKTPSKESTYPYGYTTVTSAKGYYPRIDHNYKIGGNGDTAITLELTPKGALENSSFVEVFHESSEVEMVEFLNYYKLAEEN